jgi:hypothetical protein
LAAVEVRLERADDASVPFDESSGVGFGFVFGGISIFYIIVI